MSVPPRTLTAVTPFSQRDGEHADLHSFPTRRSSDLGERTERPEYIPPIEGGRRTARGELFRRPPQPPPTVPVVPVAGDERVRSEEHTSELQSPDHLVCRLLLEENNIMHSGYRRCSRV